jgi:hypothetical protein
VTDRADYAALRHAPVKDDPEVVWVAIGHWTFTNHEEWCVEYWDAQGEADRDRCFATEAEALAHASGQFDLDEMDWRDGPNPFGLSEDQSVVPPFGE